jgi:hypothetical protein
MVDSVTITVFKLHQSSQKGKISKNTPMAPLTSLISGCENLSEQARTSVKVFNQILSMPFQI